MSSCAGETGLVVWCCCPCLVLQVTVFLLVRLPRKVVVKTKRIILRRRHRRRPPAPSNAAAGLKMDDLLDLDDDGFGAAFGVGEEDVGGGGGGDGDGDDSANDWKGRWCFAVVRDDGVWEAIIEQEGLFWFGSFWGQREQERSAPEGEDRMGGSFRLPVALERSNACT
ncbi:hypothetical protein Zm00014a_022740 [Zea mays]|jgi:hypothetical protein|uniref:Uncharacterized protein n=1 Tax=Zea mays TaxID=4577 RepID=A0A3L6EFS9_MAIZE|nr:uncharacterized protein LOC109939875 [Zea mays]PWZ19899.1 hypothetical protein Zm00014a_022740 [Zea mays]|eukprot:XP_020393837.1 uncharacterized protein LOC109939875 [Zea mays]